MDHLEDEKAKKILTRSEYESYVYLLEQPNQLGMLEAIEMYKRKKILADAREKIDRLIAADYDPESFGEYQLLGRFIDGKGDDIGIAWSRKFAPPRKSKRRPFNILLNRRHLKRPFKFRDQGEPRRRKFYYALDDTDDEEMTNENVLVAQCDEDVVKLNDLWKARSILRDIINAFFKRFSVKDVDKAVELFDLNKEEDIVQKFVNHLITFWKELLRDKPDVASDTTLDSIVSSTSLDTLFDTLFVDTEFDEAECRTIRSFFCRRVRTFNENIPGSMGHIYELYPCLSW